LYVFASRVLAGGYPTNLPPRPGRSLDFPNVFNKPRALNLWLRGTVARLPCMNL